MIPPARLRNVALVVVLIAAAGLSIAAARFELAQAIDDRLGTAYTLGAAQFQAPGAFQWPRLTEDAALARCDICAAFADSKADITKEYGVLVRDDALNDLSDVGPFHPPSPADVPLPRVVWIMQWHPTCDEVVVLHSPKCATYELIDDTTGWVLDVGQVLTP